MEVEKNKFLDILKATNKAVQEYIKLLEDEDADIPELFKTKNIRKMIMANLEEEIPMQTLASILGMKLSLLIEKSIDIKRFRSSTNLKRKETYPVEDVLSKVQLGMSKRAGKAHKVDFDGDLMNMASQRYKVFKVKGIKCVDCGIEGKFFAKEKHFIDRGYHFNLYAINENGDEVLMTKDHIIPVSKGGKNILSNYQPMCTVCNLKKGDTLEEVENERESV